MSKVWMFVALVIVSLAVPRTVLAETPSEESVRELMNSMGTSSFGEEIMEQILPELQYMLPGATDSFWDDVRKEVGTEDLIRKLIPVYQKHLTAADVQAINAFYKTEAGAKLIQVQDLITQETYAVGEEWGRELVEKVVLMYHKWNQGADTDTEAAPAQE